MLMASEVNVDFLLTSSSVADRPTAMCRGCGRELRPVYDNVVHDPERPEFWDVHSVLTCLGVFRDELEIRSRVGK